MNESDGKKDQEQGLYRKYNVERLNDPSGKHKDCAYFVLDLHHDPHAVAALEAYSRSCKAQYPTLAFDLRHTAAATARRLGVEPTPSQAGAIPEGMVLVPMEPTEAMLAAAYKAAAFPRDPEVCAAVYRAMLAAAPASKGKP